MSNIFSQRIQATRPWLVLACVAIIVLLWMRWRAADIQSRSTLRQVEESLKREINNELPVGSDKVRVEEFLRTRAMYTDGFRRLGIADRSSYDGAAGMIYATSGDLKTSIYFCKIVVLFKFTDENKLLGYSDKLVCNGLF